MDKATSKRALPQSGGESLRASPRPVRTRRERGSGSCERPNGCSPSAASAACRCASSPAAAQVNIASIGYHFDNKEGLLSEVYRRHCEPMIEERLRGLAASSRLRGKARVAAIIEAFIRPALQQVEVEGGEAFIRLRAVLSGENSELLEKLVAENFDQSSTAFIDVLCECLPHLSRTDVCWRFHFLLGSIYYTAAGPHRISAFSNGRCNPANTEDVIKELVPFMTRAFQAPPTKPQRPARKRR